MLNFCVLLWLHVTGGNGSYRSFQGMVVNYTIQRLCIGSGKEYPWESRWYSLLSSKIVHTRMKIFFSGFLIILETVLRESYIITG